MDYKDKIIKALELSKNFDEVDYVQNKIKTTSQINRKTKQGRELTEQLLELVIKRKMYLVDNGEQPF